MKILKISLVILLVITMLVCACGDEDNGTDSDNLPAPGKITAIVSGITGQDSKLFAVQAYDYDWSPGTSDFGIAGYQAAITGDNFSSSVILLTLDDQGEITADEKIFDPGTYSVVFIVATGDGPPEYFVEMRIEVDGDVNAAAPTLADWAHP